MLPGKGWRVRGSMIVIGRPLASLKMKMGDKMRVSYDKKTWKDATISMLAPKAEAGSGW